MIDLKYEQLKLEMIENMPFDDYFKKDVECIKFEEWNFYIFFLLNNFILIIASIVMCIYLFSLDNLELFISFLIGSVINSLMWKKFIYIHEKLHMLSKCFNNSNSRIVLNKDKLHYGYIHINEWIVLRKRKAINAILMPWYIMTLIPLILFLLFGINKYICIILALGIIQHSSCIKDIYLAKLIMENFNRNNLVVFPPSKYNFGSVLKI